jgi:hypothetical protein
MNVETWAKGVELSSQGKNSGVLKSGTGDQMPAVLLVWLIKRGG